MPDQGLESPATRPAVRDTQLGYSTARAPNRGSPHLPGMFPNHAGPAIPQGSALSVPG